MFRSSPALQVWYSTVKGIKPWLAPDAKNTRTNEQGGHTIWYDEPQLLQVSRGSYVRPCCTLALLIESGKGLRYAAVAAAGVLHR